MKNGKACGLLFNERVKKEVRRLRHADSEKLAQLAENIKNKRISWFKQQNIEPEADAPLDAAYQLFLKKLDISAEEAPVVVRQKNRLVIHSRNCCPTLEACKILGRDTREICRQLTEGPTQALLQQINPKLRFTRNYNALRPYTPYCEEMIILANKP